MSSIESGRFYTGCTPYSFSSFEEEEVHHMDVDCEPEKPLPTLTDILTAIAKGDLHLGQVPIEFRNHFVVILFAVQHDGLNLQYAPEEFRNNRTIVMAAVQQTWLALRYASLRLRGDRTIVSAAVRQDCLALMRASKKLQKDPDIFLIAVCYGRLSLQFVPEELLSHRAIVLAAVEQDGLELRFVPEPLCHDEEVIRTALRQNVQAFGYIRNPAIILSYLQGNPELFQYVINLAMVLAVIKTNGHLLRYVSSEFRANLQVVLLAVENDWRAFYSAPEELQRNVKVISAAFQYHPETFKGTEEELYFHRRWILKSIERNPRVLQFVSDQEIILEALQKNWRAGRYIDQMLFQDRKFAFKLLDEDQRLLRYVKDREIVLQYIQEEPSSFCFVSKALRHDREITISALYNDRYAFEYVPPELWKEREVVLAFLSDLAEFWEEGGLNDEIQSLLIPILQNTSDREIAFRSIQETSGWAFQHLSEEFRGDRAIALFAVRSNPEAFLYVSEELSRDPVLILSSNGEGVEGTFRIAYEEVAEQPRQTLANLLDRIEADLCFPFIEYIDSPGVDAGGLTRDLVSRLFKALFDVDAPILPVRRQDGKCIPQLREISSLSYSEQAVSYRAIGAIFAFGLTNYQGMRIGMHFHEILFSMIHSITQEEMSGLRLMNEDEYFPEEIYKKLLKIYLKNQYPAVFGLLSEPLEIVDQAIDAFVEHGDIPEVLEKEYEGALIADKKTEFLMDYRIHHVILAVLHIAKSMGHYLTEGQWLALKGDFPAELQDRIEGSLSKQQVIDALQWDVLDERTQQWLVHWIETATFKQLERFVFVMTGSFSLSPTQKLFVHLYAEDRQLPSFRTCIFTMNLPTGYVDYATFKAKLELSLSEGEEGFQFP